MTTIIAGTNRLNSNTLKVAKYYQMQLAKNEVEATILDLSTLPDNFAKEDYYGKKSDEFTSIQQQITNTNKFLFVIPEYNGSYPGILKMLIDVCAFPESFYDKKACLVGISSGKYGNIRGVEHFNGVCAYLHLNVMPLRLHIANIKQELNEDGIFYNTDTLKFTDEQIAKFIAY